MTGIRHHYTQFITEELAIHITYYNKQFSLCLGVSSLEPPDGTLAKKLN